MHSSPNSHPHLRNVDFQPVYQNGRALLMLRDPYMLAEKMLLVPQELVPILGLCDGTRSMEAISDLLTFQFEHRIRTEDLHELIETLDQAYLLDNQRYREAYAAALATYRQAEYRQPALAGVSYPADKDELAATLDAYLEAVEGSSEEENHLGRGIISPHIDYDRGGTAYAQTWKQVKKIANQADLVVLLGTDHHGKEGSWTLTRQHYATPYGVLPTAISIVDQLAESLGAAAFEQELNHLHEHSIELSAVWLHHMRKQRPCELVPILCGSFGHYFRGDGTIEFDPKTESLVEEIQRSTAGRKTLIVASADLSHVGPAFGGPPLDKQALAKLRISDEQLINQVRQGDAEGFLHRLIESGDRSNVCGASPIYLALRILGSSRGKLLTYEQCPADNEGTSTVSIGGLVIE
jgi:MEMO1 family protein